MSPQRPRDARAVPSRPGTRVPSHHPTPVRPFVVVAVAALALALAACGADAGTPASTAGPTTTSTRPGSSVPVGTATSTTTTATGTTSAPTPPVGSDEEQIRATIDTYWQEWTSALADPGSPHAGLEAVLTGAAKDKVVSEMQKKAALGEVATRSLPGPVEHHTIEVVLDQGEARATECVVDDAVLTDAHTGATLNNVVESLVLEKRLVREDGRWKIASSAELRKVEGEHRCLDT